MGIRVNIDLDVDSIFDGEFQGQIEHYLRLAVIEAIRKRIDEKTVLLIEEHEDEIDSVVEESYKESHSRLMKLYKP